MRKFFSRIVGKNFPRAFAPILGILILLPTSAQAGYNPMYAQIWPKVPSIGFTANEDISTNMRTESWIHGMYYAEGQSSGLYFREKECNSVDDEACAKAESVAINVILPACQSLPISDCVEGLSFTKEGLTPVAAEYKSERSSDFKQGKPALNLPTGGSISTWRVPGALNSLDTDLYAVNVHMEFQNFKGTNCPDLSACPFHIATFSAEVVPIKVESETASDICLWRTKTECGATGTFPEKTRVSLSLRISKNLTGFLFGRMEDIDVEVKTYNSSLNQLRVEGLPINIPGIYAFVPKAALSSYPKIDEYWKKYLATFRPDELKNPDTFNPGPWPRFALPYALAYENEVKTSHVVKSVWKFGNGFGTGNGSPCFAKTDSLFGIVSTNAAVYSPDPPTFRDGSLDFQVGGAHYLDDGKTLTKGTYDLAITSEFARCLYGFKDAPIQASVSITTADGGEQNVATQIVRQDKAKKWVFLSAKSFTFSSPVLKVKLTQNASQPDSPLATAKSKTIKCTKGATKKKVSGANPKCPSGFKKTA